MIPTRRRSGGLIGLGLVLWLVAAIVFVMAGGLRHLPPPFLVWPLTLALLLGAWLTPALRRWVTGADMRMMIALHLVRFVGIYFLILNAQGRLDSRFAVPAGIGDIIVAVGAAALLAWGSPALVAWRRFSIAWNIFGLADILLVIATATRLYLVDIGAVEPFRRLPLGLLPTFVVPLVIATHLIMLARLLRETPTAATA